MKRRRDHLLHGLEGRTKTANVFAQGIEEIWMSETLKRRKKDMLEGRLLDVCAKCQGVK